MPQITIYTTPWCSYCHRAKALLARKRVAYREIDAQDPQVRRQMIDRAHGRRTVPQIFADEAYVGDCDGIHALEAQGKLDALLGLAT